MSRRRRWRADCGHRLYRFLRDRMPARRRRRFPAVNRGRFIVAKCVLILVIVGALSHLDHDFTGAGNASGTLFVVSHRRPAVVLRAYGNFDLWLISRLIPRLYRTALSLEPSHFAYLLV